MKAQELIRSVKECKEDHWRNSDLWRESEKMLETMAEHYSHCTECREGFDVMDYPEETLIEFSKRLGPTTITEWICEEAA